MRKDTTLMQFHPVSNIFPLMNELEFNELLVDIQTNGLHEPIWLYENQIIDGRNRYAACEQLDIQPETREYQGNNLVEFVISLNLKRTQKKIKALRQELLSK